MDRKRVKSKVDINKSVSERRRLNDGVKTSKTRDKETEIEEETTRKSQNTRKSKETHQREHLQETDRTKRSSSRVNNVKEATNRNELKPKDDSELKKRGTLNGKSTKNVEKPTTRLRRESITSNLVARNDTKTSSETTDLRKSGSKRNQNTETGSKRNNNNDDDDYEDDFEDYESDFEEDEVGDDEDELKDVDYVDEAKELDVRELEQPNSYQISLEQRQIINFDISNEETNEVIQKKVEVGSKSHKAEVNHLQTKREKPSYVEHIKFDVAKKRSVAQQKMNKTRMRGEKLLDLITLDAVSFSLFSLHPRTYDQFMIDYGNTNTIQVYVQTGDDDIPEETQTDTIDVREVWTQHPPSTKGAVGGELSIKRSNTFHINCNNNKNWKHLSQFLQKASQVMCTLIEEESNGAQDERSVTSLQSDMSFSDKTLTIQQPPFIRDSAVSFTATSKLQPNLILCTYDRKAEDTLQTKENCILSHKNVICVWNVHQPTRPQKVLISCSKPLCCCFSQSAEFVFAGLVDGSVAVWDLREPESLHQRLKDDNVALRAPTYNTAGFSGHEGHRSAVVAILCRTSNDSSTIPSNKPLGVIGITQLATLEEEAVLCVWVVNETLDHDTSGDNADLGLSPGGRVHLVKSLAIQLQNLPNLEKHLHSNLHVTDFTCHHQDMNRFYITTDMGFVIMCPVHDQNIKMYSPAEDVASTAKATSIKLSGHGEPQCFLVGCSDGSVRLHSIIKEKPLMVWTAKSEAVRKVAWSENCPNIFYVLDTSGKIHLWDLCQSDCEPVSSTTISDRRIMHFDVAYDERVSNKVNPHHKPYVVFGCDNGTLEVHYLNKQYSRHGIKEKELYKKYVELL